jgi:OOP family OmpA-OmpF porin
MMRLHLKILVIAVLAVGCSAKTLPTESPLSVSPLEIGPDEIRLPDQVVVITDASGTMYRHKTFPQAKALTRSFVAAMPERDARAARPGGYSAGSIGFGGDERTTSALAPFDRAALSNTAAGLHILGEVGGFGGNTPYRDVLGEARGSLTGKRENSAIVIFSDGIPDDAAAAFRSARLLDSAYRGTVCIHTVQTGDSPEGAAFLDRLARITGCGTSRSGASVRDPAAFMKFVHDVFAAKSSAPPPPPPPPDPCSGVIRLRGVEFAFDRAEIVGASPVVLDTAIEELKKCPNRAVRVEGHTDSMGTDAYNQALGQRRAEAVRDHLVNGGISAGRVTARSFGESKPIASNDSEEGRALNRRVEIHAN